MNIPRDIPAPVTDSANERAHRLDAEAEAFMKLHASTYALAIERTLEDDREPAPWHEENIRKYWPELWTLWSQYRQARLRLLRHVGNVCKRYPT